jgi:two-component system LytT family response regulator
MKKINTIIVEDELRSADVMKTLLAECCPEIEIAAVAPSVKSAVELIKLLKPELVFLDVELPDGNGFNVLESFPPGLFNVIFVTAYEHYALKAIKASALDYLLKPVDTDELIAAIKKLPDETESDMRQDVYLQNQNQQNRQKMRLALPTIDGLKFIEQGDIIWCEAQGSYCNFLLTNKEKVLVSKPLSYFEEILDEEQFCRPHQSYIINLAHAKNYVKGRGGYLIMSDGSKVEVSVRMKNNLLDRFLK